MFSDDKLQTVFTLCNYPSLLTNGILRLEQMEDTPLEEFSAEEWREHCIGKGAAGARGDDTKTLKNSKINHGFNHELTPEGLDWNDPQEPKATRSGNARLYGMNSVTVASMAYIATQVQFALSSSLVFSRTDMATDSETFYRSLLDLLEDPDKSKEVDELLVWWNR
ncbi:hypothetical protein EDB19DRAFT_1826901 [Suillus lakei]|nr:hypothetical protein EDB19DRAFT_1826901 [Suillus lakei]